MQRMKILRMRVQSIVLITLTSLQTAVWVALLLLNGPSLVRVVGALIFAVGLTYGIWLARHARRALRAFEAEHGADAGIQPTKW